jgi:hypothetical protein
MHRQDRTSVCLIDRERRASEPPEGADGSATAMEDGEETAIQNVITGSCSRFHLKAA